MCRSCIREADYADPCASPGLKKLLRKHIHKAVAALVIPEVQFLPDRAGYKRKHPKLAYGKTCKLTSNQKYFTLTIAY
jgi:hypothetical protein